MATAAQETQKISLVLLKILEIIPVTKT